MHKKPENKSASKCKQLLSFLCTLQIMRSTYYFHNGRNSKDKIFIVQLLTWWSLQVWYSIGGKEKWISFWLFILNVKTVNFIEWPFCSQIMRHCKKKELISSFVGVIILIVLIISLLNSFSLLSVKPCFYNLPLINGAKSFVSNLKATNFLPSTPFLTCLIFFKIE